MFLSLRCIWPSLFYFTFSEQISPRWMSGCITFTGQRNTLKIQTILYAKQWSLNSRPMILDIREHEFSRFNVLIDYKFTAVSQVNWTKPGKDFIVSTNKTSHKAHTKNIPWNFSLSNSVLCKTEWFWGLRTWLHTPRLIYLIFYLLLATTSVGNKQGYNKWEFKFWS